MPWRPSSLRRDGDSSSFAIAWEVSAGQRGYIGCDHRDAGSHRLTDRKSEAFIKRRVDEDCGARGQVRQVLLRHVTEIADSRTARLQALHDRRIAPARRPDDREIELLP